MPRWHSAGSRGACRGGERGERCIYRQPEIARRLSANRKIPTTRYLAVVDVAGMHLHNLCRPPSSSFLFEMELTPASFSLRKRAQEDADKYRRKSEEQAEIILALKREVSLLRASRPSVEAMLGEAELSRSVAQSSGMAQEQGGCNVVGASLVLVFRGPCQPGCLAWAYLTKCAQHLLPLAHRAIPPCKCSYPRQVIQRESSESCASSPLARHAIGTAAAAAAAADFLANLRKYQSDEQVEQGSPSGQTGHLLCLSSSSDSWQA